ncbi:hypothetical protein [Legionella taurinensis]|uniref:Terminase small subunit n=1 Tax=Legionella taurinensis TaxID=70611 RepID=A0A3A5LE17_9GAMM|nr:hypothetical protein [Legionella taurinensis]RJT45979.1 hypothetical protein D6J04_10270 [Legionella taurinensis]RJT66475.1 hypothetical protein D6J03_10910 [Legionella taurinensis]STY27446.1 Uncharacterised protein [Legionella taurinensis]
MNKKTVGRPTKYSPDIANKICEAIASNGKGVKKLCEENPDWPNKDTIFTWLKKYPEFSDQYARAKRFQVEALIDEILDIADDSSLDQITHDDGSSSCNSVFIARSRLRIDTRKWLASKLVSKVYGEVRQQEDLENNEALRKELLELRASLDKQYQQEY